MPKLTKCECGTTYRLHDDLIGEEIRCVGCGEMLRVGDMYGGHPDRPSRRDRDDYRDEEDDRPVRKRKRRRRRSSGLPFQPWILDLVGGGVLCCMVLVCGGLAMANAAMGALALGFGSVLSLIGGIWILGLAFKEDPTTGFLCLCLPFYGLFFVVNNLDECKRPFLINVAGAVLVIIGRLTLNV